MIRHCVFVNFETSVTEARRQQIFDQIAALKSHLSGIIAVHIGDNVSPEVGMDKGFSHGFVVDFEDAMARDAYLADPEHAKAGTQLVDAADGGAAGILVYDIEIAK